MVSILILSVLINLLINVNTNTYDRDYYDYYPDYDYYRGRRKSPLINYSEIKQKAKGKKKAPAPTKQRNVKTNPVILADLLDAKLSVNEVNARLPTKALVNSRAGGYCKTDICTTCLESCKYLKRSKYSTLDITQYTYLRLCSEGCKENLKCLMDNFCLPVMEENPDYFVLCSNKCNLFEVIPQIFRTGQCD